jgi:hypothetical protein
MMKALTSLGISLLFASSASAFPLKNGLLSKSFWISSAKPVKHPQSLRTQRVIQNSKLKPRNVRVVRPLQVTSNGDVVNVNGSITNLTGTSDKMISYRHQYHLWETPDNGLHILLNQGGSSGSSLVLSSSFDNGQTWNTGVSLPNTNENSTADGFLKENKLRIASASSSGNIVFSTLNYNSATQQWSTLSSNPVFTRQQGLVGSNPSFAIDANGVYWCTFVTAVGAGTSASVSHRLYRSENQGQNWTDTGVKFGNTSNSFKRSARLVVLGDRIGVVYTNNSAISTNIFWAYRFNTDTPTAIWQNQPIFQTTSVDADPYGSHFNVVTDSQQNIHVVSRAGGRLIYLRYQAQNQGWDIAKSLTSYQSVAYANVTVAADNRVFIIYNSSIPDLSVLESADGGSTFANAYFLVRPDPTGIGTIPNFTTPRMITSQPLLGSSKLPIFRQFVLDNVQRLSLYNVNIQGN